MINDIPQNIVIEDTKYLTGYTTEISAKNRSNEAAIKEGCNPEDVTQFWFAVIKHPNRDEWAIIINAGDKDQPISNLDLLTAEEKELLITKDIMQEDGWFNTPAIVAP